MSLALAGVIGTVVSGAVGAVGAVMNAQAQSAAAKYNAEVAQQNAKIQQQNAIWAQQAGEQQAAVEEQKTRARVGAIMAAQAANGIDVNSGSALDTRSSAKELGELSALTIRSNAAKESYGYETQSWNASAEANLDKMNAAAAEQAGMIGAAGDLLGGVTGGIDKFQQWHMNSGSI